MSIRREKLSTKSAAKDMVTPRSTALKMLLGASLVAAPAAAACDPDPSYQRWAATEGATAASTSRTCRRRSGRRRA